MFLSFGLGNLQGSIRTLLLLCVCPLKLIVGWSANVGAVESEPTKWDFDEDLKHFRVTHPSPMALSLMYLVRNFRINPFTMDFL